MTHVYSAGGSRRAVVFAAIVGLHFAVLLVVLNDRVPAFRDTTGEPGPIQVIPPKPEEPVIVPPDELPPPEPLGQTYAEPEFPIPEFAPEDRAPDVPTAGGQTQHGGLPSAGVPMVRSRASLQGRSSGFAAAVRACYPAGARRDGEEGLLKLAVTISAGGQVQSWRVAESTGFPRLDVAAQCVLDKLRFNAAREDGRAIQSEVLLPIIFRLD